MVDIPREVLGQGCALLAPLAWSFAVVFFKRSTGVSSVSINLFKNTLAFVLLSGTLLVMGTHLPSDRSWQDWARLVLSGVLGLAVSDTLLFAGLRRIGAARLAVVDTAYGPLMFLLSVAFLGEHLDGHFLIGATAVIFGVALATIDPARLRESWTDQAELRRGLLYAFLAISGTATGVVIATPVLRHSDLLEVTWTRLGAGLVAMLTATLVTGRGTEAADAFRPGPVWRSLIPATLLGTWLSLILWLGGFKWAPASVATVLNQMATVYMLVLARFMLGEAVRPRQAAGGLVAAMGALWIVVR